MDIYDQILQLLENEFHLSTNSHYIPTDINTKLKKASGLLEAYWDEQNLKQLDLTVGARNRSLYVGVCCEDFIAVNGRNNNFFRLVTLSDTVRFHQETEDLMRMELQFNDVVVIG